MAPSRRASRKVEEVVPVAKKAPAKAPRGKAAAKATEPTVEPEVVEKAPAEKKAPAKRGRAAKADPEPGELEFQLLVYCLSWAFLNIVGKGTLEGWNKTI